MEFIQVVTTTSRKEDAEKIAKNVLEQRLCGCVQIIGPMISMYWWNNCIETAEEWILFIKTRRDLYDMLEKAIIEIHPYGIPEILATPIVAGNRDYLGWLEGELIK